MENLPPRQRSEPWVRAHPVPEMNSYERVRKPMYEEMFKNDMVDQIVRNYILFILLIH